ncbi:MAG: GNAT family N-acetyltransferase [Acidimicrobiales bacterium]
MIRQSLKRRASSARDVETVRMGRQHARVVPLNGRSLAAVVTSHASTALLSDELVGRCVDSARSRGLVELRTGALGLLEQGVYLRAGFETRSELRVLAADVGQLRLPANDRWEYRECGSDIHPALAEADLSAFGEDAGFGLLMLREVLSATPQTAVIGAFDRNGGLSGYAVFGKSPGIGYVQRLAVMPDARRRGAGSGLLGAGVAWMKGNATKRVLVNTELTNTAALNLYRGTGFEDQPTVLSTLTLRLG